MQSTSTLLDQSSLGGFDERPEEILQAPVMELPMNVLNVVTLHISDGVWVYEGPNYGLVQRSLFLVWSAWCIAVGLVMFHDGGAGATDLASERAAGRN